MAPLDAVDLAHLSDDLMFALAHTQFACSSLTALQGGTTSFVFRGTLTSPFMKANGEAAHLVIVKHATNFASINQSFALHDDGKRAEYEAGILAELEDFKSSVGLSNPIIEIPRCLYFDGTLRIQVIEYIPGACDLSTFLATVPASEDILHIGGAVGMWLRKFHEWTWLSGPSDLRQKMAGNEPMRVLKQRITYDTFIDVLDKFPTVSGHNRDFLEDIRVALSKEPVPAENGELDGYSEWGVIHGDFWSGNILISGANSPKNARLHIIDWEFAQCNHRSLDLGQFVGDLLETAHFVPTEERQRYQWLIHGFLQGYGPVSNEMAVRVAMHVGVHMIHWCSRHAQPEGGLLIKVQRLMQYASNMIVRAHTGDRSWFEGDMPRLLFE